MYRHPIIAKLEEIHKEIKDKYSTHIRPKDDGLPQDVLEHSFINEAEHFSLCEAFTNKNSKIKELLSKDFLPLYKCNYYIYLASSGSSHTFTRQPPIKALREKVFQSLLESDIQGYFFAGKVKDAERFKEISRCNLIKDGKIDIFHTYEKRQHSNMATHIFIALPNTKPDPKAVVESPERLDKEFHRILHGPPGTGKSHQLAIDAAGHKTYRTIFHPDMTFSAFLGSYKPAMTYETKDTSFVSMWGCHQLVFLMLTIALFLVLFSML